jgi:hypothetical protein
MVRKLHWHSYGTETVWSGDCMVRRFCGTETAKVGDRMVRILHCTETAWCGYFTVWRPH